MPGPKKPKRLRVGIITDIHLFCHDNPAGEFARYIDDLNRCRPPLDLVLNLGDMGREGVVEDVRAYARLIKRFRMPVYHTLGNHDGPVWQDHAREIRERQLEGESPSRYRHKACERRRLARPDRTPQPVRPAWRYLGHHPPITGG